VAFAELRVWEGSAGSYQAAKAARLPWGRSDTIGIVLRGDNLVPPQRPANLVGLRSFDVPYPAEPSTFALGILGAVALLAACRWQSRTNRLFR
jgi:hypothetical protein